jgi:hypothetical protein
MRRISRMVELNLNRLDDVDTSGWHFLLHPSFLTSGGIALLGRWELRSRPGPRPLAPAPGLAWRFHKPSWLLGPLGSFRPILGLLKPEIDPQVLNFPDFDAACSSLVFLQRCLQDGRSQFLFVFPYKSSTLRSRMSLLCVASAQSGTWATHSIPIRGDRAMSPPAFADKAGR